MGKLGTGPRGELTIERQEELSRRERETEELLNPTGPEGTSAPWDINCTPWPTRTRPAS
jgi:hypothetical protein